MLAEEREMIVHIFSDDKFAPDYIRLINESFDAKQHLFLVLSFVEYMKYVPQGKWENVLILHKDANGVRMLIKWMCLAEKIIFHGLFSRIAMLCLALSSGSAKTFFAPWGGDILTPLEEARSLHVLKKHLLSRAKGVVTGSREIYELSQRYYNVKCPYFPCVLYMSNVVEPRTELILGSGSVVRIQIGNSADPENRHVEVLKTLKSYASEAIHLYIPLSYGFDDRNYENEVAATAEELFSGKVTIMRDFMPRDEYIKHLESIDIGIFAHRFQQAMGNVRQLLAMGKKVYTSSGFISRKELARWGVTLYDTETLPDTLLDEMPEELRRRNMRIMSEKCSKEKLIEDWRQVFEYRIDS